MIVVCAVLLLGSRSVGEVSDTCAVMLPRALALAGTGSVKVKTSERPAGNDASVMSVPGVDGQAGSPVGAQSTVTVPSANAAVAPHLIRTSLAGAAPGLATTTVNTADVP